jgi:transglutaminase-like putative cysteine protease
MHFAIRYLSEYRYAGPVTDNLNSLRVRPAATLWQHCDDFQTRISPETKISRHVDYFGTDVQEFAVVTPHEDLTIDVRARAITRRPPPPPEGPWEGLRSRAYIDAAGEFGLPWKDQPPVAGLDGLQRAVLAETPLQTLRAVCNEIPQRFEYRPGATYVGSEVADLLETGAGVCQDFAHLALVLLRRYGIAARYVSGYLWAASDEGEARSMEVETHGWLEALLPSADPGGEPAWVSADPTNSVLADENHVKIGHGRFYWDVPPVRGIYRGTAESELRASVTMSRVDVSSDDIPVAA